MKVKFLLVSLVFLSLYSCSSTFTTLSTEEYANFSYVLPAISISERPNFDRIAGQFYYNEFDKNTALESLDNKKIEFNLLGIVDSTIRDNQMELNVIDPKNFGIDLLNKGFREKLGEYYLQLIRKNPRKVKTPDWLKDILKQANTNKNVGFFVHNSFKANLRKEKNQPNMLIYERKLYIVIWDIKGELLAIQNSEILSEGAKEIELHKAWKKTVFKLLKK